MATLSALSALLYFAFGGAPATTTKDQPAADPCAFKHIDPKVWGHQDFANPPELRSVNGELVTTLAVQYTDPATTSIAGCGVKLRTYNGALVGPTLRIRAGDTLRPTLDNRLPVESPDEIAQQIGQQAAAAFLGSKPHSYNTTNLHTHGLHVSPSGNSDNVLLEIYPQTKLEYEIKLPPGHPAGTHWYHAHTHGSTAVQVGSGMAGALIVDDDPSRIPPALAAANAHEKVMVFQTILYDATGQVNDIAAFFPDNDKTKKLCEEGRSGCTWQNSERRVTINGQIVPIIHMQPGEVQRWRMVDTSFRESLNLQLEGHDLHEIALDGLYLGHIDTWPAGTAVELEPGYRSDVLVQASMKPGEYALTDGASSARHGLLGVAERENVVAIVRIEGKPLKMKLPTDAEMSRLAPFPGVDLRQTATGVQNVEFSVGSSMDTNDPRKSFQVNRVSFNPDHVRAVHLGATDMWAVTTVGDPSGVPKANAVPPVPHVFHIHVNPFQMVRTDPQGKDELVWKDTVLVGTNEDGTGQTLNLYTHYLDYVGQFVMHCHILDHEDLGMMEIVEVVGDQPASALPGHGMHH